MIFIFFNKISCTQILYTRSLDFFILLAWLPSSNGIPCSSHMCCYQSICARISWSLYHLTNFYKLSFWFFVLKQHFHIKKTTMLDIYRLKFSNTHIFKSKNKQHNNFSILLLLFRGLQIAGSYTWPAWAINTWELYLWVARVFYVTPDTAN